MIIWSGLGILIPLVTVFGLLIGGLLGAAVGQSGVGLGLGFAIAAFGNWGLWKMIYPKTPKILIDPATGREVVVTPKHSLFFIPAKAWTWILAILAVPGIAIGISGERDHAREAATPGYKEFEAADRLINTKRDAEIHGSSEPAKQAAGEFSKSMKVMTDALFTGGSKKNLMTGGEFLTFCHEGDDTIVFLCHVPSLRSYKDDEAKDGLNKIAWTVANHAASTLDAEHKKSLVVGLRGIASYGAVMKGSVGGKSPDITNSEDEKSILIPAFAPEG
jgi:hypothetical protein